VGAIPRPGGGVGVGHGEGEEVGEGVAVAVCCGSGVRPSVSLVGFSRPLLCVQAGKMLNDPNRFKFDGDGYHLKSSDEMRQYWDGEVPGASDNTLLIAERVQSYDEVYSHKDAMPVFEVPEGYDQGIWLRAEVMKGLKCFPDGPPDGYPERIE
jgi:DNA polymerase III alpha subunit